MKKTYILHLQNLQGLTTRKEVLAEDSLKAVSNNLDGLWIKMKNNELPTGIYKTGTYSLDNGYLTVKKPNGVHDWFKRLKD